MSKASETEPKSQRRLRVYRLIFFLQEGCFFVGLAAIESHSSAGMSFRRKPKRSAAVIRNPLSQSVSVARATSAGGNVAGLDGRSGLLDDFPSRLDGEAANRALDTADAAEELASGAGS